MTYTSSSCRSTCITIFTFQRFWQLLLVLELDLALCADLGKQPGLGDHCPVTHLLALVGAGGLHRVQVGEGGQGQGHANYVDLDLNMIYMLIDNKFGHTLRTITMTLSNKC